MRLTVGVRIVAAFEATKGLLVLLAGFGVLSLIHQDVQQVADNRHNLQKSYPACPKEYPLLIFRFGCECRICWYVFAAPAIDIHQWELPVVDLVA